jgi:hypothetical protein
MPKRSDNVYPTEEDGGDAPEEDVGPAASLVDLVMLAGRSKNVKMNSFRLKT